VEAAAVDDGKPLTGLPETGLIDSLLSVLFPLRCVHCGRPGGWLCHDCAAGLKPLGPNVCPVCGRPCSDYTAISRPLADPGCPECGGRRLHFQRARAAFAFEGPARSLVHRLKYSGHRRLAHFMVEIACKQTYFILNEPGLTGSAKAVTLTYVPLHSSKLVSRGYNQAGLLARALSRRFGLPARDLLSKQHPTPSQNRLGIDERRQNLAGSFLLKPGARKRPAPGRILLVDDVYTTGSTTAECSRVLTEGLGAEVQVWTFARTVKRPAGSWAASENR